MADRLTAEDIRRVFMRMVRDSCPWDISTTDNPAQDAQELTRTLFYLAGAYDMAHDLINLLEGKE